MTGSEDTKILVVDDEVDLRETLVKTLILEGYEALGAENGDEALKILKSNNSIDFVISDIRMPGLDGIELTKAIVDLPTPRPSVILMTGFSTISKEEAVSEGALCVIKKPFEIDELLSIINV